ncbi:Putative hemolysin [Bauldia litoralis]|uniref:L-ornithine N(alpha)-acyltransferase n=2 Tax=Bauldia litoralis TaxID=665467 RepID=A0A1G6BK66_9HYPH|nr:Putative hemolysin [Bauldia litoralis]
MVYVPLMPQRLTGGMMRMAWRRFDQSAASLGRIGSLEVRLARSSEEVKQAQRLRYRVFYEEMSAVANARAAFFGRDADPYDKICDHLLVLDHDAPEGPEIVGTYRLLRQEIAERRKGFYSSGEFQVAPLIDRHAGRSFLELGRSCVLKPYRTKRTVELLWHGIWSYVRRNDIDVMIGCASLEGTDPRRLAPLLGFLRSYAPTPEEWRVKALPGRGVPLDAMSAEPVNGIKVLRELPPLIKGYLRLGAYICEEAVVDWQFGTTDVFIVLPLERINTRYINYYGPDASRYAA